MFRKTALGIVAVAILISPPAFARPKHEKADTRDPNRLICRSHDSIGSRLKREKACLTPAQWAEQQRTDRLNVERAQTIAYSQP